MTRTTTIVIGAGQAGLAMSRCPSELGIEHVVLERGKLAERWRSHSWDSLHLLTPNWMTRLPGFRYDGPDRDGFMSVPELIAFLERYAVSSDAPVLTGTAVENVERSGNGFRVVTSRGIWSAASVVVATGFCDVPAVPAASRGVAPSIQQIAAPDYRRPDQLPAGGVLVVGASSTGVQLADEIQRSGRPVTLAVGRHTRLPRRHRGRDIFWWLDQLGVLSQGADAVRDLARSRQQPSLQLVGTPDHASLDLAVLHGRGVRLVGRVRDISGHRVTLADDVIATTAAADIKMAEILTRIDQFIETTGIAAEPPGPFHPTWPLAADAPDTLNLKGERIKTMIWATGYRRAYPWLRVPVFDADREIRHTGGITPAAGLFVLGLNFQRRRNSSFIDGVGDDARVIAHEIAQSITRVRVA
ncbi:MAG TPA: NAD(P)/FAD-dependent oxidoreductase [Thermomicrobiales bacterium]|nr:NAD(P)/FAD-dependent oxidoreductase [Thermomicrobiales bacterium]